MASDTSELDRLLEVEKGQVRRLEDEALYIPNLGACMFLSAYRPEEQTGYLAHFRTAGNTDLDGDLDRFLGELEGEKEDYNILAGGTMDESIFHAGMKPTIHEARESAEEKLRDFDVVFDWDDGLDYSKVHLDPENGVNYEKSLY